MYETATLKAKIKLFGIILLPILITQVSLYLMNFFDTVMSGRFSAEDLAGVAIGSSLWVPVFTGIQGIILAITPIIAHLIGGKQTSNIAKNTQQGIYVSIALAIIVLICGFLLLDPILNTMDLEAKVHHTAKYYLITLSFGIIPLFIFNTIRCFIDALGQTRMSMFIILISLPLNIMFNYIFIFGKFGVPAFGGVGSGIATAITYWLIFIIAVIVVYVIRPFRDLQVFRNWTRPSWKAWREQLLLGIPIGFAVFFETSIFSAVTLLLSVYSTYTIAAHQAAISFASLLYMLPLSVGIALTIAVGFEVGAGRYKDARSYSYIGLYTGIAIAIFCGIILYVFNTGVASLYSTNTEVIELTKHFIFYAIFFQLADAFAAPIQGALRGYKDVNITLFIALISYWVIGLPSGFLLAKYTALEPYGYWVGLIIGLSFGAIALFYRLIKVQNKWATNKNSVQES